MLPIKTVVVTGAAGFIGSHLAETLVEAGWNVLGLDILDDGYDPDLKMANLEPVRRHPRFHLERLDIRDRHNLKVCLQKQKPAALMHLAARVGAAACLSAPELAWDVNVNGTRTVFEACRDSGIRMIHVSTAAVFSGSDRGLRVETDPLPPAADPYVKSKQAAETVLREEADPNGPGPLILRLASTYGPRQRPGTGLDHFVSRLYQSGEVCLFSDRAKTRDLLYVKDAATALMKSLGWNNRGLEIIHIGGGKRVDMLDLVQKLASRMGIEPTIRWMPAPAAYQDIPEMGVEKAVKRLGFKAETPMNTGLEQLIKWKIRDLSQEKS